MQAVVMNRPLLSVTKVIHIERARKWRKREILIKFLSENRKRIIYFEHASMSYVEG